jgi:hypothetical protein
MSELEVIVKSLGPVFGPYLFQLWQQSLQPAIAAKLVSGSPEIQVVETAFVSFLNSVIAGEIPKL